MLYRLCYIATLDNDKDQFNAALYVWLSLCFTYDLSEIEERLLNYDRQYGIISVNIKNNTNIPDAKKRSKNCLANLYKNTAMNRALFALLEIHERTLELMFGYTRTKQFFLPNYHFVILIDCEENEVKMYTIGKYHMINILYAENIKYGSLYKCANADQTEIVAN